MLGFHTSVGQAPFGFCCCTQFSSYSGLVKTQQLWSPRRRRSSAAAAAAGKNGGLLLLSNKSLSYNHRRKHKSQSCRALGQLPKAEEGNAAGGGGGATTKGSMFGTEQELSGPQKFLEGLPASARYATSAVIVVGALAAGYALGARVKGTQGAAVGGALALGAIGGASAFALNAAAPHVAAVQVRNALVNHSDPSSLRSTEIDAIAQKYGSSRAPLLYLSLSLCLCLSHPPNSSRVFTSRSRIHKMPGADEISADDIVADVTIILLLLSNVH
jgi:hypothetical protein